MRDEFIIFITFYFILFGGNFLSKNSLFKNKNKFENIFFKMLFQNTYGLSFSYTVAIWSYKSIVLLNCQNKLFILLLARLTLLNADMNLTFYFHLLMEQLQFGSIQFTLTQTILIFESYVSNQVNNYLLRKGLCSFFLPILY